jgi:hypothetical protein
MRRKTEPSGLFVETIDRPPDQPLRTRQVAEFVKISPRWTTDNRAAECTHDKALASLPLLSGTALAGAPTGSGSVAEGQPHVLGRDLTELDGCVLLSIQKVMRATGLGRTRIYSELKGALASVRVGRRRLIPVEALRAWLANLQPGRGRFDAA